MSGGAGSGRVADAVWSCGCRWSCAVKHVFGGLFCGNASGEVSVIGCATGWIGFNVDCGAFDKTHTREKIERFWQHLTKVMQKTYQGVCVRCLCVS